MNASSGVAAAGCAGVRRRCRRGCVPAAPGEPILTVCADPNNMPFSNRAGEGFENHIAQLSWLTIWA